MNINIAQIINNKLNDLEQNHTIENAISETFEKSILKGVTDALDSWKLKSDIEKKVAEQVSQVVADLDFSTYNGFIAEQMKKIVENTCREDLRDKIQKTFENMFLCKRENIKLSEIFEKYREIVCHDVDEAEKYSRERFHVKCERDERYGWINCEIHEERSNHLYGDIDIKFTVHVNKDGTGWIGTVYLNGNSLDSTIKFSHMNDVEIMLIQAVYNKLPIIIDIEDEDDIDNSYDVDI